MKRIVVLLAFALTSCSYFEKQVPNEQELLQKELKAINWNQVDEYPSIAECEKLTDATQRKQCFFEFLSSTIQQKLDTDTLSVLYPELDTIEVKITVNPDATLVFEPQFPQDSTAYDKEKIDSILRVRLTDLPKINPAIKRGIPVKTQFILPVIIRGE
ncbi:hypothetical protein [Flavobacterium sp. N1719]|uniref:hypothetical protein n=1 Tax=Flavobacterium sp. N1719 TaxID=2885633 RepID=UPI0022222080|nr:hypothetical protein [Flavobacterium sp. N1719]